MLDLIKKIKTLIIGEPWDSRSYKQMMKRVKNLPKDYHYVFRRIRHYMTIHGLDPYGDLTVYTDLVDLFETNAADGRKVLDVIGSDVGGLCDELVRTSAIHAQVTETMWGNINKDITEKLGK